MLFSASRIRKVFVPVIKLRSRVTGFQRILSQSIRWNAPLPLMLCFIVLLLFVQARSLPIHIGFLFIDTGAKAMTKGCKHRTCCTPLCYLDKDGRHHCVHSIPESSCDCHGSSDHVESDPVFLSIIATLPKLQNILPSYIPEGYIKQVRPAFTIRYVPTPFPPPK